MPAKPFLLPENAPPGFHLHDQLAKTGVLKLIGEENVFLAAPQLGAAMNRAAAAAYACSTLHKSLISGDPSGVSAGWPT